MTRDRGFEWGATSARAPARARWGVTGLVAVLLAALLTVVSGSTAVGSGAGFSDGFESGSLAGWTTSTSGTGSATVAAVPGATGAYAARLTASGSTSHAYLRRALATPQTSLSVSLRVDVIAEGAAGSNVPLVRLFDAGGTRLLSVYRQNQSGDKVYVQHSGTWAATTGLVPLGTWKQVAVRVVVDGGASTLEVRIDGALVYSTATASLPAPVASVQVGNDTLGQAFDLAVDEVVATGGSPDPVAPETTIVSGPTGTVGSTAATFEFSSSVAGSSFVCRLDTGAWAPCTSPYDVTALADGDHTFEVRATDPAGVSDPTPATRTWTVRLAGSCDPSQPAPTTGDPGTTVIAETFEQGLGAWHRVTQENGASITTTAPARTGRCAAVISVPAGSTDGRAHLRKGLPAGTNQVWASGWFNTLAEGGDSDWNTPTFRLVSQGRRVFDVSRQNQYGTFFVRYPSRTAGGWTIVSTGRRLQLDRWYHVRIHLTADDLVSTARVWLDGTLVYDSSEVSLGVQTLETVQVGAEHQNQFGVVAADDVVVKAVTPATRPALLADGFEKQLLAWDRVSGTGGGTVTAQTATVRSGAYAARLAAPDTASAAYLQHDFEASETDLTAALDVYVVADSPTGSTLPLLTLQDPGGAALAALRRRGRSGALVLRVGSLSTDLPASVPAGRWTRVELRAVARAGGSGTVTVRVNGTEVHRTDTAPTGVLGTRSVRVGTGATGTPYTWVVDDVLVTAGNEGYRDSTGPKLLVADNLSRRLLILDYHGRLVWEMRNPTGRPEPSAGPLGVRWMPGNRILATFGTGEVGLIDVATKTWVWKTSGYGGDWFQSPYDAEILPDGNLAVALRFNNGGRISVYDRTTGTEVWKHYLSNAHSVRYRTVEQSYASDHPTLLVGGWGNIREVAYRPNGGQNVTWQVRTEYTHDAIVVEDDRILTTEGYYIQKIDRAGNQVWRRSTPEENRRIAVNPQAQGGYVYTVADGDRIEVRDGQGHLIRQFSMLSDGSMLDLPYGIQVVDYPG